MLFDWVYRQRVPIIVTTALTVVLCALGIPNLTISPDNRVFYGQSNQYFDDFQDFEANYTSNNNILFVISSKSQIHEANYPDAIRWLTEKAWLIDNVIRVDSLATYPYATSDGDSVSVSTILDYACPLDRKCDSLAGAIFSKRELLNRLVSVDLKSTGILATLTLEIGTVGVIEMINQQATNLVTEFEERFQGYELVFTGGIPMMAAFAQASADDLSLLLPIAITVIVGLLFVFLGGARPTLILVSLGAIAIIVTLGLAGWFGHVINTATSIVPLIVLTLVITSSMHVLLHFQRAADGSADRHAIIAASKAALENNIPPVLASALTSIIGLLSLSFVDSPPLQQLGQLSAIGVFVGCVLTLTFLPIALTSLRNSPTSSASTTLQHVLNRYAKIIETKKTYSLVGSLMFIFLLGGIPLIHIDDNFIKYFDTSTSFRIQTDRVTELLAGPNHIEVLVEDVNDPEGVFSPKHLLTVKALSDYIRDSEHVSNVHSFFDLMRQVSLAFSPGSNIETSSADELAQWFLIYELSLQRGQSNTDFVNRHRTESRISVLLGETSSRDIQRLESNILEWQKKHAPDFRIKVTGENIPVAHLSELNIKSMIVGLGGSIFLTFVLIAGVFRRFKLGVAALISVLVPIICGFGVWGWTVGSIGLASTAVVALTIGVVVDDAIHLSYRYLDGITRLGLSAWESSAYSIHRAGTAITTTSIVMVGGLSILLFSTFEVNSSFGACTCLIIALALLFDLLVLPRILVWTDR